MKVARLAILAAILSSSPLLGEVKLKDFNKSKKDTETKLYLAGLGRGMLWANIAAHEEFGKYLYCQPPKLTLGVENYITIIEKTAEELKLPPDTMIEQVLIRGLMNTFPCGQPKP